LYFAIQDSNICTDDFERFVAKLLISHPKTPLILRSNNRYSSQVLAVCDKKYENILPGQKICIK